MVAHATCIMLMLAENKPIVFATVATRLPLRVERFCSFSHYCVRLAHPVIGPGRNPKKYSILDTIEDNQKNMLLKNPIFLRGLYMLLFFFGGWVYSEMWDSEQTEFF
jgi:hypothetical protein